jgi:Do/DeqQ family serine protease
MQPRALPCWCGKVVRRGFFWQTRTIVMNFSRLRVVGYVAAILAVIAAAPVLQSGDAAAQRKATPKTQSELKYSFAPVVKRAAPAVVNVSVSRRVRGRALPFDNDPFFRELRRFFGDSTGIPRDRVRNSLGSGVIIRADGIVITNYHVVAGGRETRIRVALPDRREFDARVILADKKTDLAVLKIDGKGPFPFLKFVNSDRTDVGDLVLAIGNPFGVGQTVTSGIISGPLRSRIGKSDYQVFLQTDAAINPGNSGGALVDMTGRLLGINTVILSRSGGSQGVGFAIPSNLVRLVVESALNSKKVVRPWLGASFTPVTRDVGEALGMTQFAGAFIESVREGGPASRAGLQRQDVIVAVGKQDIDDPRLLIYRLAVKGVGASVRLKVIRNGREIILPMTLEAPPKDTGDSARNLSSRGPFEGLRVANITPALADRLALDDDDRGVVVLSVRAGSLAERHRIRPNDIIMAVSGEQIKTVDDLERVARFQARSWQIQLKRKGRLYTLIIRR